MTTFYSRSHDAVIRVYDVAGNVIETHEQAVGFTTNKIKLSISGRICFNHTKH